MKILLMLIAFCLTTPAVMAAEPAPVKVAPQSKVDITRVKQDITKLTPAQKQELIGYIKKQLPKPTAEQKHAKEQASLQRWQQLPAEGRAEYREKYAATWARMDDTEKQVQREKIAERLRALPQTDQAWIIKAIEAKEGKHE